MRRFYKPSLCIPQHFLLTNPNLHHGLLWAIWTYMLWRSTNGVFCLPEELVLTDWDMNPKTLRRVHDILIKEGWLQRDVLRNTGGMWMTRTWPHKTSRTGSRHTRRTPLLPATHSSADKTDAPAPLPTPCARSKSLLVSPAACASPSPCADSTNQACGYLNTFCSRIRTCTTGC